jgi:hypothetical protein
VIEKPTNTLLAVTDLDSDVWVGEVKLIRGKKAPLTAAGVQGLHEEYTRSIEPAYALAALIPEISNYLSPAHSLLSLRNVPAPAVLVVVTVVAMIPFPPLIDGHDGVLGKWRSERPIPLASFLNVQALDEGTAKPVD